MKVYRVESGLNIMYARILAQMGQDTAKKSKIIGTWDDLAKGNNVPDFIRGMYDVCKKKVAMDLVLHFNGLDTLEFILNKNPKEQVAKILKRLKWLPNESPELVVILTRIEINLLPISTVEYNDRLQIKKIIGSAELKGDIIVPREQDKGLFFSKQDVSNFDFFKPKGTKLLLCNENVKKYIERKEYTNFYFLEIGEII